MENREIKIKVINEDGLILGYDEWSRPWGWTHICLNDRPEDDGTYPIHSGTMPDSINNFERLLIKQ